MKKQGLKQRKKKGKRGHLYRLQRACRKKPSMRLFLGRNLAPFDPLADQQAAPNLYLKQKSDFKIARLIKNINGLLRHH